MLILTYIYTHAVTYLGYTRQGMCSGRYLKEAPLIRFVFDICYPIDIFNGLNFVW